MISVVVIDDNKPTADRIVNTVPWGTMGCEVVAVRYDGLQGKQAIAQYLPELIITDIRMPNLSGLETIELMRTLIPNSKVIFISAYDEFEYAYRAIKLNAHDYLIKPFSQTDLLKAIRKAVLELNGEKADSQQAAAGENQTVVQRILEYFDHHIGETLTMEELAKLFGLSASHLGRMIQQETGKRFMELTTQMRMDKAGALLCNSDYRVSEIGEMVGYKSYLAFYKVFCKTKGISPTEYAKRMQAGDAPREEEKP